MILCQGLPCTMPSGNPTATTNVPMDGNDPRGCRDWQWAEWDQELKVSEESRGLSETYKLKKKKKCCKVCLKHQHGPSCDMGTPPPPTPNYACSHSPLGSRGRSHMGPSEQLGLLPATSCQAQLCWEPTKLSTQPWDQPSIDTVPHTAFDIKPDK